MAIEMDGVPLVSITHNATYGNIRFGEQAAKMLGIHTESRIMVEQEDGEVRMCVLPELSATGGIKIHQSGISMSSSSITFRDFEVGKYVVEPSGFDGEVDWFALVLEEKSN